MLFNGQNQFAMADPVGFDWQNCLMLIQELHCTNLGTVYTIKFSVIKVEIFRWEILGFEVFVRNY